MKGLLFIGSFLIGTLLPQADKPALTLKECVQVVADYEVHHPVVPDQTPWLGMTDPNTLKIFVIKNATAMDRQRTALHELIHAARAQRHELLPDHMAEELEVQRLTDTLYTELFGQ